MPYADADVRRAYHREYDREWRKDNREKIAEQNERTRKRLDWNAYQREWRRKKREEDPRYYLRLRVKRDYKLTLEEYDALIEAGCAICGAQATGVDHCHRTGVVRAGLCNGCNVGLGAFTDDPARLRAAADYLERLP